jgi:hypothetical protein
VTTSLTPVAMNMLGSLHQHKLLTTTQLHALHRPGKSVRGTQRITSEQLAARGLVQSIGTAAWAPTSVWFLSALGHEAVPSAGRLEHRPREVTREAAAGALQRHTLRVNDVGISFVMAARARGDECGPLAWRHEIEHPIGPARRGRGGHRPELVRPDALLRYTLFQGASGASPLSRFVELDRGTMQTEDLNEKLRRYARLWAYVIPGEDAPAWRETYPLGFPEVVMVFCDRPRAQLERRMATVMAFAAHDPVIQAAEGLVISCTLLDDLVKLKRPSPDAPLEYVMPPGGGPFGRVFVRHDGPGSYCDWLGRNNSRTMQAVNEGQGALL